MKMKAKKSLKLKAFAEYGFGCAERSGVSARLAHRLRHNWSVDRDSTPTA
jgi:hypothetical protein